MTGPARRVDRVGLVFVDLDDTVVQGGNHVSHRMAEALVRAHKKGCVLAVASGRPVHGMPSAITDLGCMDFYLCSNGARTYDAKLSLVAKRDMPAAQVLEAMDALTPLGAAFNCFLDGIPYGEFKNVTYIAADRRRVAAVTGSSLKTKARIVKRMLKNGSFKYTVPSVRPYIAHANGVEKLGCSFSTREACDEAVRVLGELGGFEVARIWARELEVTAKGVSKGSAGLALIERLGLSREEAVAFGDSANDLPIMKAVGRFVAVANSADEVLAVADETCPSVWEDGVAVWLDEHIRSVPERQDGAGA